MCYNYQKESDNVVMSRFFGIVKQVFNYFDYVTLMSLIHKANFSANKKRSCNLSVNWKRS